LLLGLAEVALGVLVLANPGATLVATVTVGGIWAVAVGAARIVLSFQVKRHLVGATIGAIIVALAADDDHGRRARIRLHPRAA
jgi:uncharacterized membrane protein HdeD (DUF308 family)